MPRVAAALIAAASLGIPSGAPEERSVRPCAIAVRGAAVEDLSRCEALVGPTGRNRGWFLEIVAERSDGSSGAGVHLSFSERPAAGKRYGFDTRARGIDAGSAERLIEPTIAGLRALPVATHRTDWPARDGAEGSVSVVFSTVPPERADGRPSGHVHGTVEATLPPHDRAGAPVSLHGTF